MSAAAVSIAPLAAAVRVLALHCVQDGCSSEGLPLPSDERWALGPLDQLVAASIPVAVVFVHRRPSAAPESDLPSSLFLPLHRLRTALSRLLTFYPHLTGRLHCNPEDGTREVRRLGSGALLVEAACALPLSAFEDGGRLDVTRLPDGGNGLLPPYDSSPEALSSAPLLVVQHTRFDCGSVSLGVRLPHCVCDAAGFFQLVADLCHLYREGLRSADAEASSASLTAPPHLPSFLAPLPHPPAEEDRRAWRTFRPALYRLAGAEATAAAAATEPLPVRGRVLRFSAGELRRLKARATDPTGGGWVSTFDALSAHLFQRVHLARVRWALQTGADPALLSTDFLTPVNCRSAERLHLPPRYFANALLCAHCSLHPTVLRSAPLFRIARAVRDCVRLVTAEEALGTARWMAAQPDKGCICQDFRYANGGFMVSQWNKVATYQGLELHVDNDGRGLPPALVAPPFTPISLLDGLAYIVAMKEPPLAATAEIGVDVHLALCEPLWAILEQDPAFRQCQAE